MASGQDVLPSHNASLGANAARHCASFLIDGSLGIVFDAETLVKEESPLPDHIAIHLQLSADESLSPDVHAALGDDARLGSARRFDDQPIGLKCLVGDNVLVSRNSSLCHQASKKLACLDIRPGIRSAVDVHAFAHVDVPRNPQPAFRGHGTIRGVGARPVAKHIKALPYDDIAPGHDVHVSANAASGLDARNASIPSHSPLGIGGPMCHDALLGCNVFINRKATKGRDARIEALSASSLERLDPGAPLRERPCFV